MHQCTDMLIDTIIMLNKLYHINISDQRLIFLGIFSDKLVKISTWILISWILQEKRRCYNIVVRVGKRVVFTWLLLDENPLQLKKNHISKQWLFLEPLHLLGLGAEELLIVHSFRASTIFVPMRHLTNDDRLFFVVSFRIIWQFLLQHMTELTKLCKFQ